MTQKSQTPSTPVVLELAPLPREQAGPFLILGVEKTAGPEQIEENWARRVIWARKKQTKTPLENVNWARETITDPDKRVLADSASLNIDTTEGVLKQLVAAYDRKGGGRAGGQPIDVEKHLADYSPAIEVPEMDEIRKSITIPQIPREFPAIRQMLELVVKESIDPWNLDGSD